MTNHEGEKNNYIQFLVKNDPTVISVINNDTRYTEFSNTAYPFEIYVDNFIGGEIDKLNRIKSIIIRSNINKNSSPSSTKAFQDLWSLVNRIQIQLYINGILVLNRKIDNPEIKGLEEVSVANRWVLTSRRESVEDLFMEVRKVYQQAILSQNNASETMPKDSQENKY